MKKIKFSKDEGSLFYKELSNKVDAYFHEHKLAKSGGRTMMFKIILYFGMDILFYTLMINSSSLPVFCVMYFVTGICILLTAFNISHDAAHGVAVKSKWWNKLLFSISFNMQGNNAYVWGKNHTESHHLYTNIEGSDIDVLNNPLLRMTENQTLKWYHKYQHIYAPLLYLFYSLNWFLFRDILMLFNFSSRTIKISIPGAEVLKLIFYKLFYIGYMIVIPWYFLPFGLGTVILVFVINHFIISFIFIAVLVVAHLSDYVTHPEPDEDGKLDMSWAMLQLTTSVDYHAGSLFLNWTLGGFNAHALHHLLPNFCHTHYVRILPIFKEVMARHGLVYTEMNYTKAIRSHFRFLYKMGHDQKLKIKLYER